MYTSSEEWGSAVWCAQLKRSVFGSTVPPIGVGVRVSETVVRGQIRPILTLNPFVTTSPSYVRPVLTRSILV